jgi:predicted amidohydrolase
MRIGIYQFAPVFGDREANLRRIESAVTEPVDLLVLPELCTTGYQFVDQKEVYSVAEEVPGGPTTRHLVKLARRINGAVVAGLAEKDDEKIYNTAVVVTPHGYIGKYRKLHLFFEEKEFFLPGNLPLRVWDIGPARIGVMICFDWIFPEVARILALQGADILCLPANLVLPYCQSAMVVRSIENRVFAVVANRIGTETRGGKQPLTFTGKSQVSSPKGNVLLQAPAEGEGFYTVDVDPSQARDKQITSRNHLFQDRRPEYYGLLAQEKAGG